MKTCPFCEGSNLVVLRGSSGEVRQHSVTCLDCNTNGPSGITREQAEEAWNQRIILYCIETGSQLHVDAMESLEKISDQTDRILTGLHRMAYHQLHREKPASPIRFDGLYQSDKHIDLKDNCFYWNYLRFYADGTVLGVWTTRQTKEFIAWLQRENESSSLSRGFYKVSGSTIRFSTNSSLGVVEYQGTIADGMLELEYSSETNGKRGLNDFRFVSFASQAPAMSNRKIYAPRPGDEFDYVAPTPIPRNGNGDRHYSLPYTLQEQVRALGRPFHFLKSLLGASTTYPASMSDLHRRTSKQS